MAAAPLDLVVPSIEQTQASANANENAVERALQQAAPAKEEEEARIKFFLLSLAHFFCVIFICVLAGSNLAIIMRPLLMPTTLNTNYSMA